MNEQEIIDALSGGLLYILGAVFLIIVIFKGVRIVPQSEKFVVERFGRLKAVLGPGINFIVPFLDVVRHKVSILERQLPNASQDAITRDNVLVEIDTSVFYRILEPEKTVYRIRDVDGAISTTVAGIVRAEIGKMDLDEVQSNRSQLIGEIKRSVESAVDDWGIEVTRAEILDVNLDQATRDAMLQQLNAERTVVPATVESAIDIGRLKDEASSLCEGDNLFDADAHNSLRSLAADVVAVPVSVPRASRTMISASSAGAIPAHSAAKLSVSVRTPKVILLRRAYFGKSGRGQEVLMLDESRRTDQSNDLAGSGCRRRRRLKEHTSGSDHFADVREPINCRSPHRHRPHTLDDRRPAMGTRSGRLRLCDHRRDRAA